MANVTLKCLKFNPADYIVDSVVRLGKKDFNFEITYNERQDCFYLGISHLSEGLLVDSIKLVPNNDILHKYTYKLGIPDEALSVKTSDPSAIGSYDDWANGKLELLVIGITDD